MGLELWVAVRFNCLPFPLITPFFNVFIFEWPATNMLVVAKFFFESDPIHA